ncbi:hypothetical protein GCM10023116_19830 [Kistimonas scapharcae]|uniref:Uncharacterized protein n=1 Tax=Kistimonas scapharcae TaxID=1036133 RepID=A0ABP8V135_9GAMM
MWRAACRESMNINWEALILLDKVSQMTCSRITVLQLRIIKQLHDTPNLKLTALADRLCAGRETLRQNLVKLVDRAGLLECNDEGEYCLTSQGQEWYQQLFADGELSFTMPVPAFDVDRSQAIYRI